MDNNLKKKVKEVYDIKINKLSDIETVLDIAKNFKNISDDINFLIDNIEKKLEKYRINLKKLAIIFEKYELDDFDLFLESSLIFGIEFLENNMKYVDSKRVVDIISNFNILTPNSVSNVKSKSMPTSMNWDLPIYYNEKKINFENLNNFIVDINNIIFPIEEFLTNSLLDKKSAYKLYKVEYNSLGNEFKNDFNTTLTHLEILSDKLLEKINFE